MTAIITVVKLTLLHIFLGIALGSLIAGSNGLITGFFTSEHYTTNHDSRLFVIGIAFAYGLLFAAVSAAIIYFRLYKTNKVSYLALGFITLAVALMWRVLGSAFANIDCGYQCVDTAIPKTAHELATARVAIVCIVLYVFFVIASYVLVRRAKRSSL